MGGGDLNLKKSWHPQTLRNVEKVWKAEQKAEAEAKKIDQLRKELEEERAREGMQRHAVEQGIAKKKGERLDWMYAAAAGQVDRELYLLGKAVDKAVDPMAQDDEEESSAPGASFMNDTTANTANDLAAKVRDDPLFLIKKKEEEKRKELINNPVKMKQLKQMLQANLEKSKKKKKKKDKKKKSKQEREEKRKKRHADTSSESQEDEREVTPENGKKRSGRDRKRSGDTDENLREMLNGKKKRRKERHRDNSDDSEEDVGERKKENEKKRSVENGKDVRNGFHRDQQYSQRRRIDDENERRTHRNGDHFSYRHRSPIKRRPRMWSRSKSPQVRRGDERRDERRDDRRRRRSPSSSPSRSRRNRVPSQVERRRRSPSPSPPKNSRRSPSPRGAKPWQKRGSAATKHMDDDEKQKRLAAMMDNAKWRDEQRGKNIKRYKEEDAKLEEKEALDKDKSASFLQEMKIQSFSSKETSSVGDRIRRNINSVQRTSAALESFLSK
ncbi:unnamed protein product [Pocillopora meandrina]|uniref:CBF1-interacting co-repressor CIR N-terminal domain-containing protein n=1 Tax=Pocillopora meandrina TaxID=46732 RepID=A0AAU9X1L2_9CNID|nr:unnamed protein product [Pocillopora meandrina]